MINVFDGQKIVVRDEPLAYDSVKVGIVRMHSTRVKAFNHLFANVFHNGSVRVVPRSAISDYVKGYCKVISGVLVPVNEVDVFNAYVRSYNCGHV